MGARKLFAGIPLSGNELGLVAAIVTVGKLSQMATVDLRVGSYAFVALIFVSTWANSALETEAVWSRLEDGS